MISEQASFTIDQIRLIVFRELQKIDDTKLYFECKKLSMKLTFRKETLQYIKCCVALHNLGLPITAPFVADVMGKKSKIAVLQVLHSLGDKNVLALKRSGRHLQMWVVTSWFLDKIFTTI